ncbi:hypothetical protein ACFLVO_02830 [Chloroflexota bacterium]
MKQFLSVILVAVLVLAVGSSLVNKTMASFFDIEVSTENHMQSAARMLELSGGPIQIDAAGPSTWYEHEMSVVNVGNLDGTAWLHLMNLVSSEDEPGQGKATSEPELTAEEGGCVGENAAGDPVYIGGLGTDCGDDTLGPADLAMAEFVDVEIWYDADDDETTGTNGFEELVAEGKLAEIECEWYPLGLLPASTQTNDKNGGGWSTYFPYTIGGPPMESVLIAGQHFIVGRLTVETAGPDLIVTYDTTAYEWSMKESHLYVDDVIPLKMAPGQFPYTSNPDNKEPDDDQYNKIIFEYLHQYIIPLTTIGVGSGDTVYIAAHAAEQGGRGDTAWAMGDFRNLLIRLHFPDIDEDDIGWHYFDDSILEEMKWDHWPTNAYMGDKCVFDIEFLLAWEGQEPPP